ncbi:MAG: 4'-phosphopantetheinyl transferase superfamily protein [Desulfobacteraceae bacterium]|nr:4'-phosphopantetheinyl transferase superfamily protein [Desulfobacteraceae bacterium]
MEKGKNGQPQPSNGTFWSVSHKNEYAAGLVSKSAAGIDLEKIKDISVSLFNRIVRKQEKQCFREDDYNIIFFRCFTAKEAVLKSVGVGLIGLSDINVIKVEDSENILLRYKNIEYKVEHVFFDKHIASVVKDNYKVKWHID